jgi:HaeIII restriction endonuclease.
MGSQTQSGKAFEYAVASAILDVLGRENIAISDMDRFIKAGSDYRYLEPAEAARLIESATRSIELVCLFEPNLEAVKRGLQKLSLQLPKDSAGEDGDVRDIVLKNFNEDWEIGFSAKHNHEAVKHSRLSMKIDFGSKWFGVPASARYFDEIEPVFDSIENWIVDKLDWKDLTDIESAVYMPLLEAFRREIHSLQASNGSVIASNLVEYLVGKHDFYKIMKLPEQTVIQAFNLHGCLNRKFDKLKPILKLDRISLPSRIIEIDYLRKKDGSRSRTTLVAVLDAGWSISFRLHSASTKVERSLKFDINFHGVPVGFSKYALANET